MRMLYAILLVAVLAPSACACSMGMSLDFVQGLPEGYYLARNNNDAVIAEAVKRHTGRSAWHYARDNFYVKAPNVAENVSVVPVTIGMAGVQKGVYYNKLIVLLEEHVNVLVTRGRNVEIPHRNRQVPINLKLKTISAVKQKWVATYDFMRPTMSVSMRLNLSNVVKAKVLALLVPADKTKAVQVIRHNNPIRVHHCDSIIYVDGPMPKDAANGFYYF